MKMILFLMLIMGFISPLINAYEITFYYDKALDESGVSSSNAIYRFFTDESGNLKMMALVRRENGYGMVNINDIPRYYNYLNSIRNNAVNFINNSEFNHILSDNLQFLNDFYLTYPNPILNYFYNENNFNYQNYLNYDEYELLYNENGLAVETIVNGVWAGLYTDNQKTQSGAMYDKSGTLVYYNGKEVTPVTSFLVWLQKFTKKVVLEAFEEMQRSFVAGTIAAVVLVLAIVRLVLELLPSSITPRRRRYYGGGGGRRTLPDYGDGSQVAASVRARLAAKNRALKARAYDRSGLEQSLQNSILFDLENSDR